jgi:hypothetical protein
VAGQEVLPLPGRTPDGAGRGKPALSMWEESLCMIQLADLAGRPCPNKIDAADIGTPTSRTLPNTGESIPADPRPVTWAIHRLLGQQDEPPRR